MNFSISRDKAVIHFGIQLDSECEIDAEFERLSDEIGQTLQFAISALSRDGPKLLFGTCETDLHCKICLQSREIET